MRLAILSDIHGNPIALDAVLKDVDRRGGADGYWVLGDLVALGYDPVGVLERLAALPNVRCVRGNTDRYTLTGDRAFLSVAEAQANSDKVLTLVAVAQGFAWTYGCLSATDWVGWLAVLPVEQRLTLPGGTRLLGVHASPGHDDGPCVDPNSTEEELRSLMSGCEADEVANELVLWDHLDPNNAAGSVDGDRLP